MALIPIVVGETSFLEFLKENKEQVMKTLLKLLDEVQKYREK
jgi:hypothetical protein